MTRPDGGQATGYVVIQGGPPLPERHNCEPPTRPHGFTEAGEQRMVPTLGPGGVWRCGECGQLWRVPLGRDGWQRVGWLRSWWINRSER